jgi:hypothetical protein
VPTPPEPAWISNFLALLQLAFFDQRLPCGQRHQRNGGGILHRQVGWLEGQRIFFNCDEFGKRADAVVVRPRVDLIAGLEAAHARTDTHHHAGEIIAQNQRHFVRQQQLELAIPDLIVQRIDAGSVNLHQDVTVAQCRLGQVA